MKWWSLQVVKHLTGVIRCHLNSWVTDQSLPPKGFHRSPGNWTSPSTERPQLKRIATCRRPKKLFNSSFEENFREKTCACVPKPTTSTHLKAASLLQTPRGDYYYTHMFLWKFQLVSQETIMFLVEMGKSWKQKEQLSILVFILMLTIHSCWTTNMSRNARMFINKTKLPLPQKIFNIWSVEKDFIRKLTFLHQAHKSA